MASASSTPPCAAADYPDAQVRLRIEAVQKTLPPTPSLPSAVPVRQTAVRRARPRCATEPTSREHIVGKLLAVVQPDRIALRLEAGNAAGDPLTTGFRGEGGKVDGAIAEPIVAGDKTGQHAGVDETGRGRDEQQFYLRRISPCQAP
jgi:hypothetical protein